MLTFPRRRNEDQYDHDDHDDHETKQTSPKIGLNDALAVHFWQIEGLKISKSEALTMWFKLCFKQSQKW